LILLLRLGLPVTAFFVAFNPIWGFSWYFNTESWATGIYQKLTELRVDNWRANMFDAVTRAYGGGDEHFRINPQGVAGNGDFSFLGKFTMAIVGHPRFAAATIFRRLQKARTSPNPRKNSLRSVACWRPTTSAWPWPAIRTTLSITGKTSPATAPRA
jgi:hypothetical protein